jgi:hypothetical protein
MKYRKCECGNNEFFTTKTVCHELIVVIDERGNMIDGGDWNTGAINRPDSPYGYFTCTKCPKMYVNLLKKEID